MSTRFLALVVLGLYVGVVAAVEGISSGSSGSILFGSGVFVLAGGLLVWRKPWAATVFVHRSADRTTLRRDRSQVFEWWAGPDWSVRQREAVERMGAVENWREVAVDHGTAVEARYRDRRGVNCSLRRSLQPGPDPFTLVIDDQQQRVLPDGRQQVVSSSSEVGFHVAGANLTTIVCRATAKYEGWSWWRFIPIFRMWRWRGARIRLNPTAKRCDRALRAMNSGTKLTAA